LRSICEHSRARLQKKERKKEYLVNNAYKSNKSLEIIYFFVFLRSDFY